MARPVFDSSPIAPAHKDSAGKQSQQRASLKRTASTASLLTPPHTVPSKRRAKSSRSRSKSKGSDEFSDDALSSIKELDEEEEEDAQEEPRGRARPRIGRGAQRLDFGNKKQKTTHHTYKIDEIIESLAGGDPENPFWQPSTSSTSKAGKSQAPAKQDEEDDEETDIDPPSSPVAIQLRARAPVSPPPSRRKSRNPTAAATTSTADAIPAPTTPTRRKPIPKSMGDNKPQRDSPSNPFLDLEDSPDSAVELPEPRTPTVHEEKPTITYVFRGVKATYANPLYNLSPSAKARSELPIEHPDYSPSIACPPRLLFPAKKGNKRRARDSLSPTPAGGRSSSSTAKDGGVHKKAKMDKKTMLADNGWSDDEDDDEDGKDGSPRFSPPKKLFLDR